MCLTFLNCIRVLVFPITLLVVYETFLLRGRSHNMTSSPRGGGGFQMMTIDDEGEGGGVLANDDVITKT